MLAGYYSNVNLVSLPVFPGICAFWSLRACGCLLARSQTDELCTIAKMKNANILYSSGSGFASLTVNRKFAAERSLDDCIENFSSALELSEL